MLFAMANSDHGNRNLETVRLQLFDIQPFDGFELYCQKLQLYEQNSIELELHLWTVN